MGLARKNINFDRGFSHVMFRTNSGEFFFDSDDIKDGMIFAARKYKNKYGIKIFDYCLMSTHAHFVMYYPTVDDLSRFMHDMNLMIAKIVNESFERKGKAIRDRFLSPIICDINYCMNLINYVWMNPVKAGMISIKKAQTYKYCSLYYRYHGLKDPLSDSYRELKALTGLDVLGHYQSEQRFTIDRLNAIKSKAMKQLDILAKTFEHAHTIGPTSTIKARLKLVRPDPSPQPDSS